MRFIFNWQLTDIMPTAARSKYGRVYRAFLRGIWQYEWLEVALRIYRDVELVEVVVGDEEHEFLILDLIDEGVPLSGTCPVVVTRVTEVVGAVSRELRLLDVYIGDFTYYLNFKAFFEIISKLNYLFIDFIYLKEFYNIIS